jgi:hypothetical protein
MKAVIHLDSSIDKITDLVLNHSEPHKRKLKWIHLTDYFGYPVKSQVFDLRFILTNTLGQGCAFTSYKGDVRDKLHYWLGRDFLDSKEIFSHDSSINENFEYAMKISSLDSICGSILPNLYKGRYEKEYKREKGDPSYKNKWRTMIVLDEVKKLLGSSTNRRILNIGVVASFIGTLRKKGYDVVGTDFHEDIINTKVEGAMIKEGKQSPYLAKNADLVIATGMTITTKTIDSIIKQCNQNGTKIIIFAETGHNFACHYIQNGVDTYLSESFPFYNYYGESEINIYKAK